MKTNSDWKVKHEWSRITRYRTENFADLLKWRADTGGHTGREKSKVAEQTKTDIGEITGLAIKYIATNLPDAVAQMKPSDEAIQEIAMAAMKET